MKGEKGGHIDVEEVGHADSSDLPNKLKVLFLKGVEEYVREYGRDADEEIACIVELMGKKVFIDRIKKARTLADNLPQFKHDFTGLPSFIAETAEKDGRKIGSVIGQISKLLGPGTSQLHHLIHRLVTHPEKIDFYDWPMTDGCGICGRGRGARLSYYQGPVYKCANGCGKEIVQFIYTKTFQFDPKTKEIRLPVVRMSLFHDKSGESEDYLESFQNALIRMAIGPTTRMLIARGPMILGILHCNKDPGIPNALESAFYFPEVGFHFYMQSKVLKFV